MAYSWAVRGIFLLKDSIRHAYNEQCHPRCKLGYRRVTAFKLGPSPPPGRRVFRANSRLEFMIRIHSL